ncbi:MAG: septum formation initiator family protein [Deltaproteobacteria bacterium]|nr:septum formation initiator family protein [Deltaproteobacteria bacterium]
MKNFEGWKRKYIFLAVIPVIGAFAVFGDKGLWDVYKLRKERDGILKYNQTIEAENKALEEKITLLNTDKRYIGYIARTELGKLGRNEVVYKIEDQKPEKPPVN